MLFSFKETLCNFVHFGQQTNIKYYSPQSESDCGELLLNVCWRPEMTIDQHLGTIMNTKIAPLRPKVCSSDHDVHFVFRRHGCCNCFETPELQNQAFLVTPPWNKKCGFRQHPLPAFCLEFWHVMFLQPGGTKWNQVRD